MSRRGSWVSMRIRTMSVPNPTDSWAVRCMAPLIRVVSHEDLGFT